MEQILITDSVHRKMAVAVAIRFGVVVGLFGLPFVLWGRCSRWLGLSRLLG